MKYIVYKEYFGNKLMIYSKNIGQTIWLPYARDIYIRTSKIQALSKNIKIETLKIKRNVQKTKTFELQK